MTIVLAVSVPVGCVSFMSRDKRFDRLLHLPYKVRQDSVRLMAPNEKLDLYEYATTHFHPPDFSVARDLLEEGGLVLGELSERLDSADTPGRRFWLVYLAHELACADSIVARDSVLRGAVRAALNKAANEPGTPDFGNEMLRANERQCDPERLMHPDRARTESLGAK